MSKDKQSIESIWDAIKIAGFTKLGFIGAAILAWFLGITPLGIPLGWCLAAIAVYVNVNPIWKYLVKLFNKEF